MLTGTPLDMTPFGPLLTAVGVVYWLLALGLAAFALWVPGRWWIKVPSPWTPEGIEKYRREKGTDIPDDSYRFALQRSPIGEYTVRYGITWDDISTREDREHWIAGGSLKVIDLQTKEVIAERIGYMMDRGQGSTAGFRSPCLYAERTACPEFARSEAGNPMKYSRSRAFVFNVLKPITEN